MHSVLKNDHINLESILKESLRLSKNYFDKQHDMAPGRYIPNIALQDLPEHGMGAASALKYFEDHFADDITNSAGPRYFGFVTGGSTPASIAGDWLVSAYDQNACGSNDSIAPQLEKQTIHFFKQMFGLHEDCFGSFVSGATLSNFVGLALGRQWVGEQFNVDFSNDGLSDNAPVKILSGTPHSSVFKSLSMLGVGRKAVVKVDVQHDREAVDVAALERALKDINHPVIVVANAGTVNTVDFDDLDAIGKLKSKYNFWLHVDAAFGGFAACSEKYSHLLKGIHYADSITIDAHKWLNVPYDAAMQFTRHRDIQLKVFQNSAAYLGDPAQSPDYFHYTPENSRRFRALPSWFTLMAYGKDGYREIVERNCDVASYFAEQIEALDGFTLLAPVRMNVVCFTLDKGDVTAEDIRDFLKDVRDDGQVFFTPTAYKGKPAIRAAISNWQTQRTEADIAIAALQRIAKNVFERKIAESL